MFCVIVHRQVAGPPIPQRVYALEHQVLVYSLWAIKVVVCMTGVPHDSGKVLLYSCVLALPVQ